MSRSDDAAATLDRVGDAVESVAERLRGDLLVPDDEGYREARTVWNGLVEAYPALVARCAGAADVATAVEFARENDLSLSVHSGGHHESGSAVAGELVVDLSAMNSVQVDPAAETVRVEPGATAGDLHHETAPHGLAAPTGSADSIGLGGSTLGGGIGWVRREYGLGVDALRSVELVTADGRLRHASPDHNEDLFWAVRGAGGEFGVVTAMEFDLFPVGPEVATLGVFYPADHTEAVLDAHRSFVREGHEALTTIAIRAHVPPFPMIPEDARGEPAVAVLGCYAGPVEEGLEATAPLRELAEPLVDMSGPKPYLALHELGSMLYPDGDNYCWRSAFVDELTDEHLAAVDAAVEAAPSPTCGVSVWPFDGAVSDVDADATAFPWRDEEYILVTEANWQEGDDEAHKQWARETDARFRELGAEGAYAGYFGLGETDEDVPELVYGDNRDRLADLKAEYDPENVFGRLDPAGSSE